MTRKMKPVDVELDEDLREAILASGVKLPDGSYSSVLDLVTTAQVALGQANAALLSSPLAGRAALLEMKRKGLRGYPSFRVSCEGEVFLQISYEPVPETAVLRKKVERKKSDLQSLDELRAEAAERGIDISDLGRKKFKIIERLAESIQA